MLVDENNRFFVSLFLFVHQQLNISPLLSVSHEIGWKPPIISINTDNLRQDFSSSILNVSPLPDIKELSDQYDTVLFSILDKYAPLRTRAISLRPHARWFNNDIREQKIICRELERRWRRPRLASLFQSYADQRLVAKMDY